MPDARGRSTCATRAGLGRATPLHAQTLGDAALSRSGEVAEGADYEWDTLPNLFLYSRADTIYGGTNQIQRNLIAERGLGMPREPRGDV